MRRRRALPAAVAGLAATGAVVATTGLSGAAFVASSASPQPAGADSVQRWVGLAAPSAGECTAPAGVTTTGSDAGLRVAVAGSGRTVDCALVLVARDPLPEGAASVSVRVPAGGAITALDGSGATGTVTLAPGERRAVRLGGDDASTLAIVARAPGDTTDFLSYAVPVGVTPVDGTPTDSTPPTTGTPSDTTPPSSTVPAPTGGAGDVAPAAPATPAVPPVPPASGTTPSTITAAGQAVRPPRACLSRRHFVVHLHRLPRGQRYASARVRIDGHAVRVHKGRSAWTAETDLRGRPRQTVRVVIDARTTSGRRIHDVRTYRTCLPKAAR